MFTEREAGALLAPPHARYVVPIYAEVKVHRDYHVQLGKALYSAPQAYLGCRVSARADTELVKLFYRGQLIKTHPRQAPGERSTDAEDLPAAKTGYALRDLQRLIRTAAGHGDNVGRYAERLLEHELPWTKMRQVYRLLGLAKRYGSEPVDAACGKALEVDVVAVGKIAAMLEKATENTSAPPARAAAAPPARFARQAEEYRQARPNWLEVIDGAQATEAERSQR